MGEWFLLKKLFKKQQSFRKEPIKSKCVFSGSVLNEESVKLSSESK
jgi:hypothetical protein